MLIDTHYGAIANRAVKQKPAELVVPAKAKEAFQKAFGLSWEEALAKGLVYNAMDGAKKLGVDGESLGAKWGTLKRGVNMLKFGGGFYCGKVDDIFIMVCPPTAVRSLGSSAICIELCLHHRQSPQQISSSRRRRRPQLSHRTVST